MNLHLTIESKLVDSISIDPLRRRDSSYIEKMKLVLKDKHQHLLQETASIGEFYLDPYYHEVHALTSYA